MALTIAALQPEDAPAVAALMAELWGGDVVVVHNTVYQPSRLPGFVAHEHGAWRGLLTYHLAEGGCEIVTLNSLAGGQGVGTALIEATVAAARELGCGRVWLITTNDNLAALRFYQKRGFELCALYRNAVTEARRLKPAIPLLGDDGIPLRDELELEFPLVVGSQYPVIGRDAGGEVG